MTDTWTYDVTTDSGKVRLLAQDFDQEAQIFSDAEIQAFMDLNNQDVWYAAAQALEVIAANEVYVQKRIKILDLWTDGPREAERLIAIAKSYRETSTAMAPVEEAFDWATLIYNVFDYREFVFKEYQRQLP
jgi:hypothetical protein